MADGRIAASDVVFTCARFWLLDGRLRECDPDARVWASLDDGELQLVRIEKPGVVCDNADSAIMIGPEWVWSLTATDYPIVRALVNKALAHLSESKPD